MASKKTKVVEIEAIDNTAVEAAIEILEMEAVEVKQRGRKVDPNSARQARLQFKAQLIEAGVEIQRGRKIDPNSPRQQRLAALNEKRASGVYAGRGRPRKVAIENVMTELSDLEIK